MISIRKHGHKPGSSLIRNYSVIDVHHCCLFRYLAPSFLASLGALGYVGYAFSQGKPTPSSPGVSFLHLLGVAGGFGISFWITAVHGQDFICLFVILLRFFSR